MNGIEEAEVQEIIDHHRLGGLETIGPVYFRNQPVGCTATIIYQMYQESGVEVEPQMAGLLCSAIISDTLLFRSPTCTMVDQPCSSKGIMWCLNNHDISLLCHLLDRLGNIGSLADDQTACIHLDRAQL